MLKKITSMFAVTLLIVGLLPSIVSAAENTVELTIDGGAPIVTVTNLEDAFEYLSTNKPTSNANIEINDDGDSATTTTAREFDSFDLTIKADEGKRPVLNLAPIQFRNGNLVFENFDINMKPKTGKDYTLKLGTTASGNTTVTFDNVDLELDGTGIIAHAIIMQGAVGSKNELNIINDSDVLVKGYTQTNTRGNAIYTESEAEHTINIKDSKFVSDGNRSGIVSGSTPVTYINISNANFDVINSIGNGSNGGHWTITDNSNVNFLDNGSHGLSVTSLKITESDVNANGNGANGIHVNSGGFIVEDANVTVSANKVSIASQWTKPGAIYIKGNENIIKGDSVIIITDNLGPGLHLDSGKLVIDDSVKLTIKNNKAYRDNLVDGLYARGGGVYVQGTGTLVLPNTAIIYNNRAAIEADDIYVNKDSKLTLYPVGKQWFLNEDPEHDKNHVIDGWYIDILDSRWSAHNEPLFMELYTDLGVEVNGPLTLKAAHSIHEVEVVKTWVGGPELKPDIVLTLLANGKPAKDLFNETVESVTLVNGETEYTFTDIPLYSDNKEIEYTIKEAKVKGYTSKVEIEDNIITLTNTYIDEEKLEPKPDHKDETPGSGQGLLYFSGVLLALSGVGLGIRKYLTLR